MTELKMLRIFGGVMIREDKGRLVTIENGGLSGLITRNGIARYVQIRGK